MKLGTAAGATTALSLAAAMASADAAPRVAIPRLEGFLRYLVGTAPIGTVTMSSGPYFTAHMDFWNAWRPATLKFLLDNCINADRDCGKNPAVPF